MKFRSRLACSLLFVLLSSSPLWAERYAVLIGVGKYLNGIHGLEGPAFDVAAVRDMLAHDGYNASAVTVLLNEQATRSKIVETLRAAVSKLKAGDHLLFYYSGHGTSAFDKGLQWLSPEIGPDSGGLSTYDLSLSSLPQAVDTLVIGRRDLRPILAQVPEGAQALVVLDACYSENSAKSISIFKSAPTRGINLVDLVNNASATNNQAAAPPPSGGQEGGAYPYTNVISLAAASKDQPALDINLETMQSKPDWRTVDGKPHGALTNALLDAMSGHADTNHDGAVSYDEMFRYVRRQMEKFPPQPQLLTAKSFPLDQPALGASGKSAPPPPPPQPAPTPAPPPARGRIRVALETPDPALESKLRAFPEIEIAADHYDIVMRKNGAEWGLYDSSGVLIQSLPADSLDAVAARVRVQGKVAQLRYWSSPAQTFNVRIDAEPDGAASYDRLRSVFRVGEKVRFRISTESPAFLLLL